MVEWGTVSQQNLKGVVTPPPEKMGDQYLIGSESLTDLARLATMRQSR